MGKVWAISSGSGGVGKTMLSISLALGAAQSGKRTILLDASGVSRACDILLGIESIVSIDLTDVLTQQMEIGSALYAVPKCDHLKLTNASLSKDIPLSEYTGLLLALGSMCDILVIDLPTGYSCFESGFITGSDECLLVTRPDDASIRATERVLNGMRGQQGNTSLIVNRIKKDRVKHGLQYDTSTVSAVLDCPVLGSIPEDDLFSLETTGRKNQIAWERIVHSRAIRDVLNALL